MEYTGQTVQTVVVHMDQLTPANMAQLSQEGYTILRDPQLLIFGRTVGETAVQVPSSLADDTEALVVVEEEEPQPILQANRATRRGSNNHRK